jgi:hypothetical protein
MAKRRQVFVYDDVGDTDVEAWLERQDNKSAAIRAAIRQVIQPQEQLDASTLRRVLREELARARVAVTMDDDQAPPPSAHGDVDPEAGRRLDEMF